MPAKFADIQDAFDMVNVGGPGEHQALVSRETGRVYYRYSEYSDQAEFSDELPDDADDEEKYVAIPDKRELDLGKSLVLDFAREVMPDDFEDVRRIFSRRGAYQNFKDLLARRGARERWYEYEAKTTEEALRKWCTLNEIELID
jgi:hypothetical protein